MVGSNRESVRSESRSNSDSDSWSDPFRIRVFAGIVSDTIFTQRELLSVDKLLHVITGRGKLSLARIPEHEECSLFNSCSLHVCCWQETAPGECLFCSSSHTLASVNHPKSAFSSLFDVSPHLLPWTESPTDRPTSREYERRKRMIEMQ